MLKVFPKKIFVRMDILLEKNDEIDQLIDENELETLEYNTRRGRYKIRITKKDITAKRETIKLLLEKSYKEYNK
jgi:hypothetical protein